MTRNVFKANQESNTVFYVGNNRHHHQTCLKTSRTFSFAVMAAAAMADAVGNDDGPTDI